MKRYIILIFISFSIFSGLIYVYSHTQSDFLLSHKEMNELLSEAKQNETSLDKDILRVQNFILENYDTIVLQIQMQEEFCHFNSNGDPNYISMSSDFKKYFDSYCEAFKEKVFAIENFKSQNAIYRNSLFFVFNFSNEMHAGERHSQSLGLHIADSVLNYALLPDNTSRDVIEKDILRHSRTVKSPELQQVLKHAKIVLEAKERIIDATEDILNTKTLKLFENLRDSYFKQYTEEQKKSTFYQNLLFILSITLLFLIIYNVLKIWKAAEALRDANIHLEKRVSKRTQQLMESQKTIVDQQQTVMMVSKMSALGEMAGGMAHEINTPLAVIQMRTDQMLESLAEDPLDKEMMIDALNAIDQTVKRISKIVNGLRSFARDGRKDPMEPYSFTKIIEDTFSLCREKFANNSVRLEYVHNNDIIIDCRPGEISQVLLNFLNNAYDAVQENAEKWVRVEVVEVWDMIQINIIDSGKGIPEDIREKMMQPFFTTKEIGKGTGLGLSISKGIIDNHNGKIQIDSSHPNTKFIIFLPKSNKENKSA